MQKIKRKVAILLAFIMIFNLLPINSSIIPVHADNGGFVFYRIKTKSASGPDTETMQLRITMDTTPFNKPLVEVTTDGVKKFITPKTWSSTEIVIDQKDLMDPLDRVIFFAGTKTIKVYNDADTSTPVFSTNTFTMSGNIPSITSLSTSNGIIYVGQNLIITGDDFTGVKMVKIAGQDYYPAVDISNPQSGEYVITDSSHIVVYGIKGSTEAGVGSIYLFKDADISSGGKYDNAIQSIYLNCIEVIKPISPDDLNIIDVRPDTGTVNGGTIVRLVAEKGKDSMLTDNLNVYFPRVLQSGLEPLSPSNKAQFIGLETGAGGEKILIVKTPKASGIGAAKIVIRSSDNKSEMTVSKQFNYIEASRALVLKAISPTSVMKAGDTTISREVYLEGENIGTISVDGLENIDEMNPKSLIFDSATGTLTATYDATFNGQAVTVIRKTDITIGSRVTIMTDGGQFTNGTSFTTSKDTIHIKVPVITLEPNEEYRVVDINAHTLTTIQKDDVVLYQREEEYTLPDAFTFIANYVMPVITSINPAEGPYNEEIFVEIKGSNFLVLQEGNDRKYPVVQIGDKIIERKDAEGNIRLWVIDSKTRKEVDGSPNNSRGDTLKLIIPANPPGIPNISVDVKVTNPDGGSPVMREKLFKFTDPAPGTTPAIIEVKPNIAPVAGGTDVKVTGSGFRQGALVTIDGVAVTNLKINGAGTEMTFKTPPGRPGITRLQIMNPQGGGLAWADFEYTMVYTSPRITKISPNMGSKGTIVTITGDSFLMPDATASLDEIYKIIGSRILFNDTGDPYDLNQYNLKDGRIVLEEFNSGSPILSLEGTKPVYNEEYSGTMLLDKVNSRLYYMYKDYQGNVMMKDWQGGLYQVVYETLGTGSKMVLVKTTGGVSTEIENYITPSDSGARLVFSLDGGTTTITLTAVTPYKMEGPLGNQRIVGQRVRVLDEKTIEVTIPDSLKEGKKDVTVINPDTASYTVVDGFNYFSNPNGSKPVIYDVEPSQGTVAGGTVIKITGKDFRESAEVYFGSEKSPLVQINERGDTIRAVLPPYPGDLRKDKGTDHIDVPVVVINKSDGGTAVWQQRFIYRIPTSYPVITSIDPNKGSSSGGTQIVILGDNFVEYGEPYTDLNGNGQWDIGEPYTDYDINGVPHPDSEGKGNGRRDDGCLHEFIDPDTGDIIRKIIPDLAPKVYFGGEEAEVLDYGYRRLVVKLPRYDGQGAVDVVIVNPDTGTAVKKSGFTYAMSSPKINSVVPSVGPKAGGTEITILGQNFIVGDPKDPNSLIQVFIGDANDIASSLIIGQKLSDTVKISNLEVNYDGTKNSDNTEFRMTYNIKAADGSIKAVTAVQNLHITESRKEYFVTFDPSPSANMFKNQDGSDLSPQDYATLNQIVFGKEMVKAVIKDQVFTVTRRLAEVLADNSTDKMLVVKTPPANTIGIKDLTVINNDGGKATAKFEYGNPTSKPRIDKVEPRRLVRDTQGESKYFVEISKDGNSQITITGHDFRDGVKVFIGDQEAKVISKSPDDTVLVVEVPPAKAQNIEKELKITVTNQDTESAISTSYREGFTPPDGWLPHWFVYRDVTTKPRIDSITPNRGPKTGGTKITITGDDFREGARVFIGGMECTDVQVIRYNLIEAITAPMEVPGSYTVEVKNYESGIITGTATLANGFTYISTPEIIALYETAGIDVSGNYTKGAQTSQLTITGGQEVMLELKDLVGTPTVVIGGKKEIITDYGQIPQGIRGMDREGNEVVVTGGTNATIIKVQGSNHIIIRTPAMPEGPVDIIVVNGDGGVSNPYRITYIRPLPGKPSDLQAEAVDGDTVRLKWKGKESIYQIYGAFGETSSTNTRSGFSYIATVEPEITSDGTLVYYVRGLLTDTYYWFRVYAVNDFGISQSYAETNKPVKTPETIRSEAKFNDPYINLSARTDWTENTKDMFIYNIGEKSLKEGSQHYQIELRNRNIEPGASRQIKIPVKLIQDYSKNYTIWDKDITLKFHTRALRTTEITSIKTNYNDAAAIIELSTPKGKRYDDIIKLLNRRTKPVKLIGIDFKLQVANKITDMRQFQEPVEATILLDSQYADAQNLELYYYNIPSNKLEKINFTKKSGERLINTTLTKPGQYVIVSY